jgi:hypothetical protein
LVNKLLIALLPNVLVLILLMLVLLNISPPFPEDLGLQLLLLLWVEIGHLLYVFLALTLFLLRRHLVDLVLVVH